MTTLALLGGTGRTGRLLIDQALVRGHRLRVLARRPEAVHRQDDLVTVVPGDARDREAVARLVQGADVVLSALGPVRGGPPDVMTLAARHLIEVLPEQGIRRLITLTGAGVPFAGDQPKPVDHIFRVALRLLQPDVLQDSVAHATLIRESDLDWTVVRVPRLGDGPEKPLRVGMVGQIGTQITRASVSRFMLDQVEGREFVRQAPAISN
ncbi:NADH-flavin reductase [Deinococcus aetherius]|uniref:NADH-flavin reductase n=1 Tax=Deinococcus aetherius TaxID=200252 RepID=A0ABN6RF13_9DEIO|nr:NAD(P)H-binding protein [Deinococcus aetherius]BDP40806.1 NADH-flavin reductase [Deinococcus aetherius]